MSTCDLLHVKKDRFLALRGADGESSGDLSRAGSEVSANLGERATRQRPRKRAHANIGHRKEGRSRQLVRYQCQRRIRIAQLSHRGDRRIARCSTSNRAQFRGEKQRTRGHRSTMCALQMWPAPSPRGDGAQRLLGIGRHCTDPACRSRILPDATMLRT